MKRNNVLLPIMAVMMTLTACNHHAEVTEPVKQYSSEAVDAMFNGKIDINNPFDYEGQLVPSYITKDNTGANPITNEGATLGRVLFYDTNLSTDNTISCASCHIQSKAFGDDLALSLGVNGSTGRHSMRLINARFSDEQRFFWDERANSLEEQVTKPIQDHLEMGFSGINGDPDINDLITKLQGIDYYQELFESAYGDRDITEVKLQTALAQFVRSIQSFDAKYDIGRAQVNNDLTDFPNFTDEENTGKRLFLDPPPIGGAGCGGCHRAPEFDIDPLSGNNGIITVAGSNASDLTNTRAPSLRDIFNPEGVLNGPLMHDGSIITALQVVNHYDNIMQDNANLDRRLRGGGRLQMLNLDEADKNAIIAFLKTLSGRNVYSAEQWSNPFQP